VKSPEVQRDFSEFLASLNAARVKYLVVGAYALAAHGAPRNTLDLDVLVQPTSGRAKDIGDVEALQGPSRRAATPRRPATVRAKRAPRKT
jgi:hypothetical protein